MANYDFSDYDMVPHEPIVTSSFFSSPDGKRSVRAYEIINSNKNLRKIRKDELDEPRFENSASRTFSKFKALFVTPKVKPGRRLNRNYNSEQQLNVKKGISYHTKNDGGIVTVTSLDLSNQNGDNTALKEFVQKKATLDRVGNQNIIYTPQPKVIIQRPIVTAMPPVNTIAYPNNGRVIITRQGVVSPCMCLECQARNRRGIPFDLNQCNCIDCQAKRGYLR